MYNGAAFFARKYCGADFLAKLADGTIQVDVMDKVKSYDNIHGFYKDDGKQSAYVIQIEWHYGGIISILSQWLNWFSNNAVTGNQGNAKMDKLYFSLMGIEK